MKQTRQSVTGRRLEPSRRPARPLGRSV